ncbi:MAG: GTP-binding protein [Firmicutes bacterium]|nr:GTP-binding protein [Bacillota bacterium]
MKVLILGGFLGSGKTTALLQLAHYLVERSQSTQKTKVVIVENEIGETGIDDKVLRGSGLQVEDLFSGCACCTVSGELTSAASRIRKDFNPDWLIVETTGLAYPRLIRDNLQAALGLSSRICILVDASRWKRLLRPMYNLLSGQIVGADVVLINKTDLVNEETLAQVEADIAAFDPLPRVMRISAQNRIPAAVWAQVLGE